MLHFCVFGGQGGEIEPGRHVYLTIFGGSELKRPTFAKLVRATQGSDGRTMKSGAFFLTLFGAMEVKSPTLAEEFSELDASIRSGLVTTTELERSIVPDRSSLNTAKITICGACSTAEIPSEDEELDALAVLRHSGTVDGPTQDTLMLGIGRTGAERLGVVRQAVLQAHRRRG
ncbi:MAG: hypothetical protein AB7N71_06835 [Phycisphaerae bacterium]